MASPTLSSVHSEMADALSCIICYLPYNTENRLPKVFPCQHTVCLSCANELCQQQRYGKVFPCPICRQSVDIPKRGAAGLQTNLDVTNMVEIMQKANVSVNPECSKHPGKAFSNVCMTCKVGMCSRCVSSPSGCMQEHLDHHVLDIDDAFHQLKQTCQSLADKAKDVSKGLKQKSTAIDTLSQALLATCQARNLAVFEMIGELSVVVEKARNREEVIASVGCETLTDGNCTHDAWAYASHCLKEGSAELVQRRHNLAATSDASIVSTKLSAVTVHVDLLRLKVQGNDYGSTEQNIAYLWDLLNESEPGCRRFVTLGGVELLIACCTAAIARSQSNVNCILGVYGNLSEHPALHDKLLSVESVNMLLSTGAQVGPALGLLPERSCCIFSFFLSNAAVEWPRGCRSRKDVSALVMESCSLLNVHDPLTVAYTSFRVHISLLSQHVSEAAKYWPILSLYKCIFHDPNKYCLMFVRERGGMEVLQLLHRAPPYVSKLAKLVLETVAQFQNKYSFSVSQMA